MITPLLIDVFILASEGAHAASSATPTTTPIDWAGLGDTLRGLVSILSILMGMFFVFAGTLGVLRLPDFYTRIHAAGMTDTLGAEMVLFGLIVQAGFSQMGLKLLLISFLLLLTSPTATHAVANAAYRAGLKPMLGKHRATGIDDIRKPKTGKQKGGA